MRYLLFRRDTLKASPLRGAKRPRGAPPEAVPGAMNGFPTVLSCDRVFVLLFPGMAEDFLTLSGADRNHMPEGSGLTTVDIATWGRAEGGGG